MTVAGRTGPLAEFLIPALVLLCMARGATAQVDDALAAQINGAIDKGSTWLLESQWPDGSFAGTEVGFYPVGGTALSLLTLAKCGVPTDHAAMRRALAFLAARPIHRTYEIGTVLLALEALGPGPHRARVEELARELLSIQHENGYWDYPTRAMDLSCTQYAMLGLYAASRMGFDVPAPALLKTAQNVLDNQAKTGAFTYNSASAPSGSMTVAGSSVLLICAELLTAKDRLPEPMKARIDGAIERSTEWLRRNYNVEQNPEPTVANKQWDRWIYYYLYGLERFGAFAAKARIGDRDWYEDGSRFLVKKQDQDGHWSNAYAEDVLSTDFALLFLTRATASMTGAASVRVRRSDPTSANDDQPVMIRATGTNPWQIWVAGFAPKAVESWSWADGRLRVAEVRWFAGDQPIGKVAGNTTVGRTAENYAIQHAIETNGKTPLRAEVDVIADQADGDRVTLQSNVLTVLTENVLSAEQLARIDDLTHDLCYGARMKVRASSSWDGGWAPEFAVDGQDSVAWLTNDKDTDSWLEIEFDRTIRVNRIMLSDAVWHPHDHNRYCRPTKVTLWFNDKKGPTVDLPDDDWARHRIDLPGVAFKVLKIHIDARVPGHTHKVAVGFREVELYYDKDRERKATTEPGKK